MIISVTKKDIENGERGNCARCPVALAVVRRTKSHWALVGSSVVVTPNYNADTPKEVAKFIRDFDAGRPVKPMRFTI